MHKLLSKMTIRTRKKKTSPSHLCTVFAQVLLFIVSETSWTFPWMNATVGNKSIGMQIISFFFPSRLPRNLHKKKKIQLYFATLHKKMVQVKKYFTSRKQKHIFFVFFDKIQVFSQLNLSHHLDSTLRWKSQTNKMKTRATIHNFNIFRCILSKILQTHLKKKNQEQKIKSFKKSFRT